MAIKKIKIDNFKKFQKFELDFDNGLNILVGDNEVGKSTILEAIHLALTGMINGKYLNTELTQYLFNNGAVQAYIDSLSTNNRMLPPRIKIELFFNSAEVPALFMGNIENAHNDNDAHGFAFIIELTDNDEYQELLRLGNIKTLPIEYYDYKWVTFADKTITPKTIPIKSALIDSSLARYQNGSDVYISRIVKQGLEDSERVKVAQAHRGLLEKFASDPSVDEINKKINDTAKISGKNIALSVELLSKNAWENSLVTCVDDIPFHYIGKGEQCIIKTRLALSDKKAKEASIILMEEPENHLTYARLNQLLDFIVTDCEDRQIIVSTHSSFVANKLGIDNLTILGRNDSKQKMENLPEKTAKFFKKLSGFDTLRLVLAKSVILVEGPSDELVLQKAYMLANNGKLPIADGVDVINARGLTFLNLLELAQSVGKKVVVVTDNDGKLAALEEKYADYLGDNSKYNVLISYDKCDHTPDNEVIKDYNYNTLENLILVANGLNGLNTILGTSCKDENSIRKFMKKEKTDCALAIFEYEGEVEIKFPNYIAEAIKYVNE